MENRATENDHAFSIELDIVKLNETEERLLIEGYIGKLMGIGFAEGVLEIKGLEGNLRINLNEEELNAFFKRKSM